MQCNQCNGIEMLVMSVEGDEITFQCPKCKQIIKKDIKELIKK